MFFGVFFSLFCLLSSPVFAAEVIKQFDVEANIQEDRVVQFQETITYDFGNEQKHGIFRLIPTKYKRDGLNYSLRLKVTSVKMDGGEVPWEQSSQLNGIHLKIGDAARLIKGIHVFQITYQSDRALNDFADHQELYWNVTGNEWEIPIEKSTFRVRAPRAPSQTECYTGILASREQNCVLNTSEDSTEFRLTKALGSYEGFTVVVGYPIGTVHVLTWYDRVQQIIRDNIPLFIPVGVFLLMFVIWWKKGREPRGRGAIIPQYEEPRGIAPAILAALIGQHVGLPAMAATILDLGRRGYLKVVFPAPEASGEKTKTVIVKKLREADGMMLPFEAELFEGIFGGLDEVKLNEYKPGLWKVHQRVRDQILDLLKINGWMRSNPESARAGWMVLAFVTVVVSFFLTESSPVYLVIGVICAIIIAGFGWQMPQMTKEGAVLLEEIKGFKQFLSVTEKRRVAFTDAPQKTPEQFARFLPAAVALGVEDQWSKHFADMAMQPPEYVQTASGYAWSASSFHHALQGLSSGLSTSMAAPASTSGSGGSGFSSGGGSGGGGGGGGGGSW